jgi:hypothetical protein
MSQTYIKNKGTIKTHIYNDNEKDKVEELKWNADYDGDEANVELDYNNGKRNKHYNFQLDNENLAELLNIPSVNMPLEKRLMRDFRKTRKQQPIYIELDLPSSNSSFNSSTSEFFPITETPQTSEIIIPINRIPRTYKIYKRRYRSPRRKSYRIVRRKRPTYKKRRIVYSKKYTKHTK